MAASMAENSLPRHADFPGIMPEIAKNTAAAHIDVILKDRITYIGKVGNRHMVAQDAAFDFHSISNATVIPYPRIPSQVSIRPNGAMAAYAHAPFNHRAGLNNGALPQLKHSGNHGKRVDCPVADRA